MLAMSLGEYRESRDIDFLCANRAGFKALRETITDQSLGRIFHRPIDLAREVRADRDGIRTFLELDGLRIKFEIVREARIDLEGEVDKSLGVPALRTAYALAEKFLANADRGLDESTLSRDLVDLSFAAVNAGRPPLEEGLEIAAGAYGTVIQTSLRTTLERFKGNRSLANAQLRSLGVEDTRTMRMGLRLLGELIQARR